MREIIIEVPMARDCWGRHLSREQVNAAAATFIEAVEKWIVAQWPAAEIIICKTGFTFSVHAHGNRAMPWDVAEKIENHVHAAWAQRRLKGKG